MSGSAVRPPDDGPRSVVVRKAGRILMRESAFLAARHIEVRAVEDFLVVPDELFPEAMRRLLGVDPQSETT